MLPLKKINQIEPSFDGNEAEAVKNYINSGAWLTEFDKTTTLEHILAEFIGVKYCHMVNNGTISLVIALLAMGIKQNDKVLVPNITQIATPNSVTMIGAIPIFVDIDDNTLCLDIDLVEKELLNNRVKAVIHVSLNGRCNNIEELVKICKKNNIHLLEDSAQSLGSFHNNKHLGTFGEIGSFSLSSPKIISTGQGGFLVTNDKNLSENIYKLKNFGRLEGNLDIHDSFGINSKFTDVQAVIGIEQMKKLQFRIKRKREIWKLYYEILSKNHNIRMINYDSCHLPMFVDIFVDYPKYLKEYLQQFNIGTRLIYPPINKQKIYKIYNEQNFMVSNKIAAQGLWLPSSSTLEDEDIYMICEHILTFINMEIKNCIVCDSSDLTSIIDMGMHPCADIFMQKEDIGADVKTPLICNLCSNCSNIQLKYITSSRRYNIVDYSYTSSNSTFSQNHWKSYAAILKDKFNKQNPFVIEIGSNDGLLLQNIKEILSNNVLGIDASEKMCAIANNNNIKSVCGVFDEKLSNQLLTMYNKADIIIANNVVNHANNVISLMKGVYNLLNDEGSFIFELPYWGESIKSTRIDQIYHEHITYFTVKSAYNILKKVGLFIYEVQFVEYHGISIRVFVSKKNITPSSILDIIRKEEEEQLFNIDFYNSFMIKYENSKSNILEKMKEYKSLDRTIVAVGAAAKGNTFLNFCNITNDLIDYVTDTSIHKINKYTPGSRIKVVDDNILSEISNPVVIILSWNISHILKPKLLKLNPDIVFLDIIDYL